jgi:hypothetical protein
MMRGGIQGPRLEHYNLDQQKWEENLMPSDTTAAPASKKMVWAGRIMSGLVVLFMLFDSVIHLLKPPMVIDAFVRIGFPVNLSATLGIILLVCVVLYAIPRTSILGAILLTGYLGGAVVTNLRADSSLFGETLFPVYFGILVWGGLYGREPRLRALIPFRN